MNKRLWWIIGCTLVGWGCATEVSVVRVTGDTRLSTHGIYYYLPRTIVVAEVKVKKTIYVPGPYQEYAEKYLGYAGVGKKTVNYELMSVQLSAVSEPDPEQVYFIQTPKGKGFAFELEDNGVLRHVNASSTHEEKEEARQARDLQFRSEELPQFRFSPLPLKEKTDTIYKREVYEDSVVVERWQIEKVLIRSTLEESAKEAAARLASIRANRYQLITFNEDVQYPAGTLETMLEELNRMEEEYFKLFTGYTTYEESTFQFKFIPSPTDQGFHPLFRFSPTRGINDSLKMVSETVYLAQESLQLTLPAKQMRGERYVAEGAAMSAQTGLAYRQPEWMKFRLVYNGQTLNHVVLPVAQMGFVQRLPLPHLANTRLSFDPSTGALRRLEIK
jgi:hypothetical protein